MIGDTYGELLILEEIEERDKNNHVLYRCKCSCGKEKIILGRSLRSGRSSSCGCMATIKKN